MYERKCYDRYPFQMKDKKIKEELRKIGFVVSFLFHTDVIRI